MVRPSSVAIRAISSSMCRRRAIVCSSGAVPGQRRAVDPLGLGRVERLGADVLVAVVGGHAAVAPEVRRAGPPSRRPSPRRTRCRPRRPRRGASTSRAHSGRPASRYLSGRNVGTTRPVKVGSSRRAACAARSSTGSSVVASTSIPEPVEQRARTERRLRELVGDPVVELVGGLGARPQVQAEHVDQRGLQPVLDGGPAVHGPVLAQQAPGLASRVGRQRTLPDPERVERDARRVQQPRDVVVGRDQQRSSGP